jgi:transcriptional regulator with GAF, ATPase, and Fis domain
MSEQPCQYRASLMSAPRVAASSVNCQFFESSRRIEEFPLAPPRRLPSASDSHRRQEVSRRKPPGVGELALTRHDVDLDTLQRMAALPWRAGNHRILKEQAALRRVAMLVARAAAPGEVFAAVTEEAGRLLGASFAMMGRYDPDGTRTVVAAWSSTGPAFPVGGRARLGGRNVATLVFQTGRAARIDDHAGAWGPIAAALREFGFRAAVGVPVSVEGGLWGVLVVASRAEPLPAGTEARLAGFTELAAIAIANAQARVELRGFAEEQAALRRVATLVARAAPAERGVRRGH